MATSDYRSITLLDTDQTAKEAAVNTAINNLGRGLAGRLVHNMASDADYTLATGSQEDEFLYVEITDTGANLTAGRNIICPAEEALYVFYNNTGSPGFTMTLKTSAGTGVAALSGERLLLFCDGTNVVEIEGVSGFAMPYDISMYASGTVSNSENLGILVATRAFDIPASMTGSQSRCETVPADSPTTATFLFKKNGSTFGQVAFATGANSGTYSMTASPAVAVSFVAGDRFEWEGPIAADSAQADVAVTVKATRTGS